MNLYLLLVVPLLSALIIPLVRSAHARMVALTGTAVQMGLALWLLFEFNTARSAGNTDTYLFSKSLVWFEGLKINFHTGVDGISVAMILLTAMVMLSGVLVSWKVEKMRKEFFLLLMMLARGPMAFLYRWISS